MIINTMDLVFCKYKYEKCTWDRTYLPPYIYICARLVKYILYINFTISIILDTKCHLKPVHVV